MTTPTLKVEVCFPSGAAEFEATDTFTRADSATEIGDAETGQPWLNGVGVWGIASNKAYLATDQGANVAYTRMLANGTVSLTLSTTQDQIGMAFRVDDSGNYWLLRTNSTTNYKLELVQDGVATVMQTIAVAPANGDVLSVLLAGDQITATVNATSGAPITSTAFQDSPWAGVYAVATGVGRFDSFSASFVWTDITSDVRACTYKRGRQHELDRVEVGTCKLTLANLDRQYEPEYADGAHYPFILPMRRVRVTATYSAVSYGRFYGFIERWPISWPGGGFDATVDIEAVDALVLTSYGLFIPLERQVLSLYPFVKAYYRLGDSNTAPADYGPNGYDPATIVATGDSAVDLVHPGLIPALSGDSGALSMVTVGTQPQIRPDQDSGVNVGTGDFTVFFLFATTSAAAATLFNSVSVSTDFFTVAISYFAGTRTVLLANVTGVSVAGTSTVNDGNPHTVALVRRSGTVELWVDGTMEDSATGSAANLNGSAATYPRFTPSTTAAVTFAEYATWERALSTSELGALFGGAGSRGYDGQTSGERVNAIADNIGLSPSQRSVDDGLATLQGQTLGALTPKEALDAVVDTEDGLIYFDGSGNLVFRDRNDPWEQITHDTYGDGAGELPYRDLTPSFDIDRIYNDIRVQRNDGAVQTTEDVASKVRYQTRGLTKTVEHSTDAEVVNQADWLLMRYASPNLRVEQMQLTGSASGGNFTKVLGTELGDRLTVKRRPPGGGDPMSFEVIVEGLEETITEGGTKWDTTWALAPVPTVWILEDPVFGILDSTTVLGW